MTKQLLLIALGGGVGSILRYFTSIFILKCYHTVFPLGTFIVNMIACFVIGIFIGLSDHFPIPFDHYLRSLLIVGLCGGYSTFSTFSSENLKLLENGDYLTFSFYTIASLSLGLLFLWLGNILTKIAA